MMITKKKRGPNRYLPVTLFRCFFLTFHGFLVRAFRGFAPPPEGRANPLPREGKAEKEANFHPQIAANLHSKTDSKKEGQEGRANHH